METTAPGFRVMLTMQIHPGMEAGFEEAWERLGSAVTGHPASLGQWLLRGTEDGVYYIISDWTDEDRFREFERSWDHGEHRTRLHPFRAKAVLTTMRVLKHMPGEAA